MSASSVWPATPDPFLFLEDLDSPRAREWVDAQNARTRAAWRDGAAWRALADRLARAYLPRDAPVIPERWQSWAYDLLQDDRHPKGVWRRAPWADWRAGAPVWETLLDIDALGEEEGEPWVFEGHAILYPDGGRALLSLSPGGSDAVVVREFDLTQRRFVADGFTIDTPGHHTLDWIDRDTVYASWDRGDASLTRSGYPFEVRRWARGAALAQAPVVFRGEYEDISAGASFDPVDARHVAWRSVDFFDVHTYRLDADGAWARYDVPSHVGIGHWRGWLVFEPRLDWTCGGVRHPGGALLAIREDAFLAGARDCFTLFSPSASTSACTWTATRHYLLASWLDDVDSRTELWQPLCDDAGGWSWRSRPFDGPAGAQIGVEPIESLLNDEVYVDIDTYLNPPECWLADLADDAPARRVLLDRPPVQFDAAGLVVRRAHARSRDGTPVPYTLIGPRDALEGAARTARPCLLAGYGGFALPNLAAYSDGLGIGWLEQGGVAVFAHIRGGGEFGPDWHLDAQREHRQCAFDDFIAIAEQLIADGVTTAAQLGIEGGSNGGLLVGACMVQRPELFGAVLCQVPLLDMQRYPLLHAGSAWLDEYGDPDDPDEAAALAAYSPYHRVAAGVAYPPLLLTTSTRDDRVHPAHARKMAARMRAQGHERVWYWENTDGGHGSADDLARAEDNAAEFGFLWAQLGPAAPRV